MPNKITAYRIVDHGIEHAQYFQGHGTAFTPYDYCVTGCGDNFAEAIEDALEQMAQGDECNGVDFNEFDRKLRIEADAMDGWPTSPCVQDSLDLEGEQHEDAGLDLNYYVSIDYNVEIVHESA